MEQHDGEIEIGGIFSGLWSRGRGEQILGSVAGPVLENDMQTLPLSKSGQILLSDKMHNCLKRTHKKIWFS